MKRTNIDMTEGPLLPKIITFTVPVILSQFLTLGFSIADMVVVGRFGLVGSVGAIGATNTMINLIIVLFLG
ncbi:MAG: MATE family efflux transporter, partial [Clostridia bacterium]|nr:MATE family efflux transporter [Clostridia bacterium]